MEEQTPGKEEDKVVLAGDIVDVVVAVLVLDVQGGLRGRDERGGASTEKTFVAI